MHNAAQDLLLKKPGSPQILDARGPDRFNGSVPEPRPGVRSGNIPGSINVPFSMLVNPDGTMKTDDELAVVFQQQGVNPSQATINTCGSGVTACIIDLGLKLVGNQDSKIYDGSWSEYGSIPEPEFKK